MKAEAEKAEKKAEIAGMNWRYNPLRLSAKLCELTRKVCEKLDVFCWILGAKDDSEGESKEAEDDHMDDPMGKVRGARLREDRQTKKNDMRKALEDAANERCPVTQHVEADMEKVKGQVMSWQRQNAELMETLAQEAQEFVCGDHKLEEGVRIGCDTEVDAMYIEAKRRIRADITGMFKEGGSGMTCLAAATHRA